MRVQLLYLSKPEAIIAMPSEQSVTGVARKTQALWKAIEPACARDDFRPHPGPLCDYCAYQAYCPAFGGDPALAAELRGPGTVIEPPLPLGRHVRVARVAWPRVADPDPEELPAVQAFDARSTERSSRSATRCSTACMYTLSSAADHSLLWFVIGTGLSVRRGDLAVRGRSSRSRWASSPALTNGPIKSRSGGCGPSTETRRGPAPLRHAPADHVVVPLRPRDRGVHRARSCSPTGHGDASGSRSPPSSPAAASTCGCTTRRTSSPAPRSGSRSATPLKRWVGTPGTLTGAAGEHRRGPHRLTCSTSRS